MPHQVYANDREMAAKSADGASRAAFPDVCHSPPGRYPGTPLPYPNTCHARDITNGSQSVFIRGLEIALEDQSYFATSYGDEAATQGLKKGVISGAVQGRGYFISWSPNVKVEGRGVTRHLDLVTHNHRNPGNTPAIPYISQSARKGDCRKDIEAVEKNCGPDKNAQPRKDGRTSVPLKKAVKPSKLAKLNTQWDTIKAKMGYSRTSKGQVSEDVNNGWLEDHCDGLWLRPYTDKEIDSNFQSDTDLARELKELTSDYQTQLKDILDDLDQYFAEQIKAFQDKATQALIKKLEQKIALKLASQGGNLVVKGLFASVPVAGWIVSGLWTAYDVYDIATDTAELERLKKTFDTAKQLLTDHDNAIRELGQLIEGIPGKSPTQITAMGMGVLARLNDCLRARRCLLVKYKDTKSYDDTFKGKGCCPGQTGHHVIPEAMARSGCPNYKHEEAPVICVEGVNNASGTHGLIHDNLMDSTDKLVEMGVTQINYSQAKKMAIKSVQASFPESGCSPLCLGAQLDHYYENCKGKMLPNPGKRSSAKPILDSTSKAQFK